MRFYKVNDSHLFKALGYGKIDLFFNWREILFLFLEPVVLGVSFEKVRQNRFSLRKAMNIKGILLLL